MGTAGRLDNTLIVAFSDHGEDLNGWYPNDKGGDELNHPEEKGHGCLLYDQTLMVPLFFWHKDLRPREIHEQVRLVDIMPTIVELAGLPVPPQLDGESLASVVLGQEAPAHRVGYAETYYPREQVDATNGQFAWTHNKKAIRLENKTKIIFHIDSDEVEVYDLRTDPLEKKNLMNS